MLRLAGVARRELAPLPSGGALQMSAPADHALVKARKLTGDFMAAHEAHPGQHHAPPLAPLLNTLDFTRFAGSSRLWCEHLLNPPEGGRKKRVMVESMMSACTWTAVDEAGWPASERTLSRWSP